MLIVRSFHRRAVSGAVTAMLAATAGLVAPLDASAQARPALTRDADNPDLAPAFFSGSFSLNTVTNTTITTVPAGKRLVIDNVSYFYGIATSGDQLNQAILYVSTPTGTQVRLNFPINPPHAYVPATGSAAQDASFSGRTYFEAGEVVRFVGGTTISDSSRTISLSITGHYVTP